jgi:hypothetical protein
MPSPSPFPTKAVRPAVCLLLGLAAASANAQDDWTQHLRIGMPITFNVKADFHLSGQFNVSGSQPGPAGVSGVNHFYDDGYVRVDQTGNAQGFTSFWGYNNASQYNAGAQTLTMHSATSFNATGSASVNDSPFVGLDLAYGDDLWHLGRARIGWEAGFGLLPIKITDNSVLNATVNRSIFTFNTGGIIMPTAPYNGGPSGLGPTIHDTATAQAGDVVPGTVTGTRSLDVILYTFRLGPTVSFDLGRNFGILAGAGPAVGIVSGSYKFDETVITTGAGGGKNSGDIGLTDVVFGGYVNAMVTYELVPHGDVYLGAQFMPLGSANVSGGGREARLNLGGQTSFSVGFNWPF